MSKFLITGATGFVGRAVCRTLRAEGLQARLRELEADFAGEPEPGEALVELLLDAKRRSVMGRAAAQRAVERVGSARLVSDHAVFYRRLMES